MEDILLEMRPVLIRLWVSTYESVEMFYDCSFLRLLAGNSTPPVITAISRMGTLTPVNCLPCLYTHFLCNLFSHDSGHHLEMGLIKGHTRL